MADALIAGNFARSAIPDGEVQILFPEADTAVLLGTKEQLLAEGIPFPAGFVWPRHADVWDAGGLQYFATKVPRRAAAKLGFGGECWEILSRTLPLAP